MKKNSLIRKASSIVGRSFLESRRSFRMGSIAQGRFGSIQDPTEHRERFHSGSMPALHSYLRTRLNSSYQSISPVRMTSLLVTEPEMHKKPRSKTKMKENLKAVREDMQMEDHMLDLDDLEVKLGTCLKTGLTDYQAAELLMRDGLNELTPIKSSSSQAQFGRHFCSGFMVLMWIAASLCFVAYLIEVIDKPKPQNDYLYIGIVLVSVILIIGLFTFCQENRSSKIMDSFTHMLPQKSRVLREGELIEVRSEELVVGDIVEIKAGDCIPADIRIISVKGLKVDHSSLTGESELLERTCECTDEVLLDSKNMAFFATTAVEGSCRGVVIATGDNTVMGRIATLTSGLEVMETPIAKEINLFVQVVTLIALVLGIIFFALCIVFGYSWIESVIFLICVLVANVPEALLCTLTVCLTKTAKRMAKKNCVAKSLESIETLGSISTICTDKTGTLTQNRMSASHMWFDMTLWKVDLTPEQKHALYTRDDLSWLALARAAVLCNKAVFVNDFDEEPVLKRECIGNPSEIGLLRFVELAIGNVSDSRFWNETVAEIPFNSRNKFQLSIHKSEDPLDQRFLVLMKGAPEIILRQCSTYLLEGIQVAIDKNFVRAYELAVARLGKLGERVFGFCQVYLPETVYHSKFQFNVENPNFQTCNLCCLGLISLIDPPRPQVPDAIAKCRVAGIKVIMVTGDHPQTAEAIARAVGIISPSSRTVDDIAEDMGLPVEIVNPRDASAAIIRGSDMIKMKQYDLDEIIQQYTEIIFARTTPLQKLFIIESLQRQGQIVAVTGDGVNDSPALRKADIGISMGIAGSDVSKQAADMILLDDNFASIVTGIEEGRMIFDNMKKAIAYVLAANIPEIVPFFCFIIFSTPLPLGVITILVIDISTNLFPAISFAHEAPESDIMRRQPRNPITDRLVSRRLIVMAYCKIGMIHTAGAFFSWATVMHMHGFFLRDLYQVRENWDSPAVNDLQDSYGQQWTYYQRKEVEYSAQTAFFVSIVITQWASLIMCRCRRGSIFQHGMRNHYINASILFGTVLAILIVYIPTDMVLRTKPLSFVYWLTPIPFALLIVIYDESRKFILRRNPGGFVENQFYY